MSYNIQPTASGYFAIDDGEIVLPFCPCCSKPFTLKAAEATIRKLEERRLTLRDLAAVQLTNRRDDISTR